MEITVAPDPHEAADAAAAFIARHLRNAAARRGVAFIAFSGGSTPQLMLDALVRRPVPWSATTIFQVDERVAPDGDGERNAELLAVLRPLGPTIRLMPVTSPDLRAACRRYAAMLPARLDLVQLGVGDDGHTASWPPGDPVADEPQPVAMAPEFNGRVRMTLTRTTVNAARRRIVLVTGEAKATIVERWMLHDRALPIERVSRRQTSVILDAAAAARLPSAG